MKGMDNLDVPTPGTDPSTYKFHWGYGYQYFPCVGTDAYCAYMDVYWAMHDKTMLYTFILWWVITGVLFGVAAFRWGTRMKVGGSSSSDIEGRPRGSSSVMKAVRTSIVYLRHRLLRTGFIFGLFKGITRVQITVLGLVLAYLFIFTFVGGTYDKVFQDGTKKRTDLGWWSDRVGSIAYALCPLTVILSMRENLFSLITGIPYQHFNFMHRALGRVIVVQGFIHTIAWTIVQGHFYNPATQPAYLAGQWTQRYYQWGFIAMMLLAFLWIGSMSFVIRWMGHEWFRKSHYILGLLFLGACWGHWPQTYEWLLTSIVVVFFDRICRLVRMALLHFKLKSADGGIGFKPATAAPALFTDEDGVSVVTLRVKTTRFGYKPGQHFFLTFPSITLLQSHPFTPAVVNNDEQLYIIVALAGETARLAAAVQAAPEQPLSVVLCGAYGSPVIDPGAENFLLVAGGTGVSFTLPIAAELISKKQATGKLRFVWAVRREENVGWIRQELLELIKKATEHGIEFDVVIYVTRDTVKAGKELEKESAASSLGPLESCAVFVRPRCADVVSEWVQSTTGRGRSQVLASGPAGMGEELREAVAKVNDAGRVWRGEQTADVGMYWDARYQ